MTKNAIDTFINIENAAHDGAFGANPRATPTDAQAKAGNYKVGRATIYGLPVAIEQPRHSYRTGQDPNGKRWENKMAAHYGYFSGTKGADGDGVDCFIGFFPQSEQVYIINQYVNGKFDEHKVCLCFPDDETAKRAYLDSYDKGWNGLHSIITASITQFKWWLKNGNMNNPIALNHLPFEGLETMKQRVAWDSAANPIGTALHKVLYEIRRADGSEALIFDSVCMADIMDAADEVMALDAMVTPYAKLERKMQVLKSVMDRHSDTIKVEAVQVSDPFKQSGVAQVAAIFELSDGQTVSIFFHNPDVDPKKIQQSDELISWKWLMNKKDITIIIAPERGQDLNIKDVAARIMKLADKNSAAFVRANSKRAEKMQAIESIKTEIVTLEAELKDVQHELEVAKVDAKASSGVNANSQDQEQALIDAYIESWQTEADKINAAVAAVDWSAITDYESGRAEENKLRTAVSTVNDIDAARLALKDAGIEPYDNRLNGIIEESQQFKAHGEAVSAYRAASDKIAELAKAEFIKSGKEQLANLPEDATLEQKAKAVFAAKGIEGYAGERIINAIREKDVESLRSILGNTDNKASRTVFELATEIKLEKTVKGTLPQIDEWAGITPEQRDAIEAEKQAVRDADNLLSDLKHAWNPLEYVNVTTSAGNATMQDWLVALYGSGYTHIETRKKGAATTYWIVNKEHKAQGFNKSKVFNAFLKAALAFGEGDNLLAMKKALKALGVDVAEQELTPVERVNAAYSFNADDDFKEWLAESVDKTEQSPFLTAKAMDEAAKRNGADIEWGFFGGMSKEDEAHLFGKTLDSVEGDNEADFALVDEDELGATFTPDSGDNAVFDSSVLDGVEQDGYVGKIIKGGVVVGRIDINGDGKALVFVGDKGDTRVRYKSQVDGELWDYMYSDDDAAEMVDSLFNVAQEIQSGEVDNGSETENEPVPVTTDSDETITPSVEEPGVVDNPIEEPEQEQGNQEVESMVEQPVTGNTELDKQRAKLRSLADLQERMKAANKIVKSKTLTDEQKKDKLAATGEDYYRLMKPDFAGRIGYADYLLTNNNAVIKNTQKRIEQLEAKELAESLAASGERETSYDFDGGTIDLDYGDDRLRVNFDSKPAPEMIAKLKQNGFKWSPTNTAWQRQLTDNAISTANYLFGTQIKTAASAMKEEVNKPRGDVIVPATETQPQGNPMKQAFIAELDALKAETNIEAFDRRLDEIAGRIEGAGLMEELDAELNETADVLTQLLAEAEKAA